MWILKATQVQIILENIRKYLKLCREATVVTDYLWLERLIFVKWCCIVFGHRYYYRKLFFDKYSRSYLYYWNYGRYALWSWHRNINKTRTSVSLFDCFTNSYIISFTANISRSIWTLSNDEKCLGEVSCN